MPVITLASGKGGVGKTLVAISLGAALAGEGADVAILDADPNKGAHRWATQTYGGGKLVAYAEADTERLAELVPELAERHAVLIADTAGFGNRSTVICIGAADGVLVPATPGEGTSSKRRRWPASSRQRDGPFGARSTCVCWRTGSGGAPRCLSICWRRSRPLGLPRLDTALSEAVAYGELGFLPTLPATGQAAAEIAALVAELRVLEWLPADTSRANM
jgi:chromosome partitioning protein